MPLLDTSQYTKRKRNFIIGWSNILQLAWDSKVNVKGAFKLFAEGLTQWPKDGTMNIALGDIYWRMRPSMLEVLQRFQFQQYTYWEQRMAQPDDVDDGKWR